MRSKLLGSIVLGLSLFSTIAVAQDLKRDFMGVVAPIGAGTASAHAAKMTDIIPDYSIRVNNNSAFRIYATAFDGYGGQKTFAIDPHFAATIQHVIRRPSGYEIRILSDVGTLIFDANVSSLACVDVYEGVLAPYARVTNYCLQPY